METLSWQKQALTRKDAAVAIARVGHTWQLPLGEPEFRIAEPAVRSSGTPVYARAINGPRQSGDPSETCPHQRFSHDCILMQGPERIQA